MTGPKFSIITINYNDNLGLRKTIESVISQTYTDKEFIVVDGDSSDGSKIVIDQYANQITKWVSEKDNGIYHAMNKGIRMATGAYLLFLNSGDILLNAGVLKAAADEMKDNKELYYGDIHFELSNKTTKVNFPAELTFDFFFYNNLSHQATFIKRTLFDDLFFYNETYKIAADWEFFIYAVCKANVSYQHLPIVITIYNGTGISSDERNRETITKEREITINKYFPAFKQDYQTISQFREKRVQQFFRIKKFPILWRILKIVLNLLILFLPKKVSKMGDN
jgi:glycosyltransferase involved in cell wall biosynthesis